MLPGLRSFPVPLRIGGWVGLSTQQCRIWRVLYAMCVRWSGRRLCYVSTKGREARGQGQNEDEDWKSTFETEMWPDFISGRVKHYKVHDCIIFCIKCMAVEENRILYNRAWTLSSWPWSPVARQGQHFYLKAKALHHCLNCLLLALSVKMLKIKCLPVNFVGYRSPVKLSIKYGAPCQNY